MAGWTDKFVARSIGFGMNRFNCEVVVAAAVV